MVLSTFDFHADDSRNVPLSVLSPKTKNLICDLLNPQMYIPAPNGTLRYWKGLADLCEIQASYEATIAEDSNPTGKILNLWRENNPRGCTIQKLLLFLVEMDRFDVVDDVIQLVDEDIKKDKVCLHGAGVNSVSLETDKHVITTDDVRRIDLSLPLQHYDAFLMYDEDDINFATQVLNTMENNHYNMKLCDKHRDFVGGGLEIDKIITFIVNRCNRVVVILSDAFFRSSFNDYYLKFARAHGIEHKRKIIPCVYKNIANYPKDIKYLFTLDYRRMAIYNFWDKLRDSIRVGDPEKVKAIRSTPTLIESPSSYRGGVDDIHNVEPRGPNPSVHNKKVKKQKWFQKILGRQRPESGKM